MNLFRHILVLSAAFALFAQGSYAKGSLTPSYVDTHRTFGQVTEYLEDPQEQYQVEDFLNPDKSTIFSPNKNQYPAFGYRKGAIWLRFKVEGFKQIHWENLFLDIDWANFETIEVYRSQGSKKMIKVGGPIGQFKPFPHRSIDHRALVFPIERAQWVDGESFYIRATSSNTFQFPLLVFSQSGFEDEKRVSNIKSDLWVHGFYWAIVFSALFLSQRGGLHLCGSNLPNFRSVSFCSRRNGVSVPLAIKPRVEPDLGTSDCRRNFSLSEFIFFI